MGGPRSISSLLSSASRPLRLEDRHVSDKFAELLLRSEADAKAIEVLINMSLRRLDGIAFPTPRPTKATTKHHDRLRLSS